ncbi:MAG: hypothetical protein AAGI08_10385 [Bacteroidota bacterium]
MSKKVDVRVRRGEWTTVATGGLSPEKVHFEVWSPHPVKWRRLALVPGFGSFRKRMSTGVWLGIVQIMMPENRTCMVTYGEEPPPPTSQGDSSGEKKEQFSMKYLPD